MILKPEVIPTNQLIRLLSASMGLALPRPQSLSTLKEEPKGVAVTHQAVVLLVPTKTPTPEARQITIITNIQVEERARSTKRVVTRVVAAHTTKKVE